jgi:hypothetical protein
MDDASVVACHVRDQTAFVEMYWNTADFESKPLVSYSQYFVFFVAPIWV